MQIIQQKLIWFLSSAALLIILYRIDPASWLVSRANLAKLKAGLSLVAAGAIIGMASEMGVLGLWLTSTGLSFYLESLFGYFIGSALIVWSLIEWSREHSKVKGDQLAKSRLKLFIEKASSIVLKEHGSISLLDQISRYLLLALDCQALTLHKRTTGLNLTFQSGLIPETEEILQNPQKESIFYAAARDKQVLSSEDPTDLHSIAQLKAREGVIQNGLSIPLISNDDLLGVLTLFAVRRKSYTDEELDLLELISSSLVAAMRIEKTELDLAHESGFRVIQKQLSVAFNRKSSLLTVLLESAKIVRTHIRFDEINLYLPDNGPVKNHDFTLPDGGKVNLIEGHFTGPEYSHLYKEAGDTGFFTIPERQAFIAKFGAGRRNRAWLEIRLAAAPVYLTDLLRAWSQLVAGKIINDRLEKAIEQTTQWLGAIRFYQERALSSNDMSSLLQEMATLLINLGMATFCRISLADPSKLNIKTVAFAQARPLYWSNSKDEIPTAGVETLRKALQSGKMIRFDQEKQEISKEEASLILPAGVRRGLIIPLMIDGKSVGLMMLGEFREGERALEPAQAEIFALDLAATISMVLSWHKDKRITGESKEGKKKLTIITGKPPKMPIRSIPALKSRINGPLAGIIASCEYLQVGKSNRDDEIVHYLGIIEKNADRIRDIMTDVKASK